MRSRPETAAEAKQRHRLGRVTLGRVTLGRVTLGRATLGRATLGSRTCRRRRPKTQRLPILEVGAPVTTYPHRLAHYVSGAPIVTLSVPTPSTSHAMLSPATVAA